MANKFDVVIIGAGPAGTVAAAKLLQENKSVCIIEKAKFPRFVIGESLLPQCMDYLKELDLLSEVQQLNFQEKTGVSFFHEDNICDFLFKEQYTKNSWHYTYQVKRAEFDYCLAKQVEKRGTTIHYEASVTDVKIGEEQQQVFFENCEGKEEKLEASFVLDASGYGRVLPRMFDLEKEVDSPKRGAIFTHVRDDNRTEKDGKNILVHAFDNNKSWIWSIPFSDGTSSVGIVGNAEFIAECGKDNAHLFKEYLTNFPGLENRYKAVPFLFEPKSVFNYAVGVKQLHGKGFALCGNSTEFLDPIFSSGVTLAIVSGYKAAEQVVAELDENKANWKKYSTELQQGINVFRTYVNAWYDGSLGTIFFSKNPQREFMEQICSVLAGYVWDESNPFVKKHESIVKTLARVIELRETS